MKQPESYYDEHYFEGNPHNTRATTPRTSTRNQVPLVFAFIDPFHTPPGSTVLELGCAYGYVVHTFRRMGYDAYGMDISQFALSMAPPAVKPYLMHGDISRAIPPYPPDPTRPWDLVVSMDVLEHAESVGEVQEILQRIAQACHYQVHVVTTPRSPHFHSDPSHGVPLQIEQWMQLRPNERCWFYESPW